MRDSQMSRSELSEHPRAELCLQVSYAIAQAAEEAAGPQKTGKKRSRSAGEAATKGTIKCTKMSKQCAI